MHSKQNLTILQVSLRATSAHRLVEVMEMEMVVEEMVDRIQESKVGIEMQCKVGIEIEWCDKFCLCLSSKCIIV